MVLKFIQQRSEYGTEKQASDTLTLTIFEDQYNNLQITSNFQMGTVSGEFMAYAAEGMTDAATSLLENSR